MPIIQKWYILDFHFLDGELLFAVFVVLGLDLAILLAKRMLQDAN